MGDSERSEGPGDVGKGAAGIVPLLEAVTYLLAPHLTGLPARGRPLISAAVLIPLMQCAVMPMLTRAARGFRYPAQRPAPPPAADS